LRKPFFLTISAVRRGKSPAPRVACLVDNFDRDAHALTLGDRTLMMDRGRIVLDVAGETRRGMTVADLLEQFRINAGKALDNDRILLS